MRIDEPSLDDMERMALTEFAALPEELRALTGDIMFMLAEEPDAQTLKHLGMTQAAQLLGLYQGAPLAARLATTAVLRHVLIHEIGHHFGLSDKAMAWLAGE